MPSDNIFGLEDPPEINDEDYQNDPPAEEVEEVPEATATAPDQKEPEAPAEEEDGPLEAVEEQAPPEPGTGEGPSTTPVPEFIANDRDLSKFKSIEALAEGYKNALLLHNRTAQRARDAEAAAQEWQNAANRAMQLLQTRQQPAGDPTQLPEDLKTAAEAAGVDEDTLRIAQALAKREVASVQQQLIEQQQQQAATSTQQQYAQAVEASVGTFFMAHPEIERGGPVDTALGNIVQSLGMDPADMEQLEYAYEIASDPDLELYVRANPHLVDSNEGMVHARNQVALNKRLTKAASTHTAAQSEAARQAALRTARVETGGGAPPTTPSGEADDWAQVLAVARKDLGASNAFGLPD